MAGKKGKGGGDAGPGEGSKKAQGQARKAEAANKKAAAENAKIAAVEDAEWEKGAKKGNAKKEAAEAKAAEAARKKAEREALLAEEEKNLPSRSGPKNAKKAEKKTKGLDLSSLDEALPALNASGIDNAMDALDVLDSKPSKKIDRRPEKRIPAAFEAWKETSGREKELIEQGGLRKSQRDKILWEEFEKSPANPMNQLHADYNATKDDLRELSAAEKAKIEQRLAAV
ncbi:hypothetical protein N0V82_008824 [Gnomoniopsis sp. IMI 355080]|nr:hypothetical protein N0V82_008824 [Gnomoniopsis sp. IMI 355080]